MLTLAQSGSGRRSSKAAQSAKQRSEASLRLSGDVRWRSRLLRLAISLGVVSGGVMVIGLAVWAFLGLVSPLNQYKKIVFLSPDKDGTIKHIYFALFDPMRSRIEIVPLPGEAPVDVVGGYGAYPLASVDGLLAIDQRSEEFRRAALSHALIQQIDAVIQLPTAGEHAALLSERSEVTSILRVVLMRQWRDWRFHFQLWRFAARVPSHQWTFRSSTSNPESGENPEVPFDLLERATAQVEEQQQSCAVAVVNTVPVPGLATRVAEVLEKSHFLVVRVTDSNQPYQQTTVITTAACNEQAERIASVIPSSVIFQQDESLNQHYRAAVVVLIGQASGL